jgi:peptide/nickel transport system substrate-binding protein
MRASNLRRIVATGVAAGSLTMGLAASAVTTSGASTRQPHYSGTLNSALVASKMRWIFPYVPAYRFTVTNVSRLQQPMYRPLYWFGKGDSINVQPDLSLAALPKASSDLKTFTINLKGWKWSNGEVISARNVEFWLNIAKSHPGDYGGYVPNVGIPDRVASTRIISNTSIAITMKSAQNPNWFLYNALATVTPLPTKWDVTSDSGAAGSGGCSNLAFTAVVEGSGPCDNVYNFLADKATPTGAASNNNDALWKVYDGPWALDNYNTSTYTARFVPNTKYDGPVKAKLAAIQFHWYATLDDEILALKNGDLDSGALNTTDVTAAPKPGKAGNLKISLPGYHAVSGGFWGYDYAYLNLDKTHGNVLLKSLAVRKALVAAVNQAGIVKTIYNGYGVPSCNPLPYLNDTFAKGVKCHYPYNPKAAKGYLTAAGWDASQTPAVCVRASGCGAGIPKDTQLILNFEYITAGVTDPFDRMVATEKQQWNAVGIEIKLKPTTESAVSNDCLTPGNYDFDICEYGGWVYSPGAYPSGEQILLTGAAGNSGNYSDATMDAKILQTTTSNVSLAGYGQYAADQVPVLFQPSSLGVSAVSNALKGALAPNPLSDYMPEYISK